MSDRKNSTKIILEESSVPKKWYNLAADLPWAPDPYYNPQTKAPLSPDDMAVIFPREIIAQEMTAEREIDIPKEVRSLYKSFRPSPLFRARALEKELGTPAKIYYKYEGGNATGSHKLNTALAQAYYNKEAGIKRISTETGAGQWGCALSMAANHFGLEATVYMVKVSYEQKPYRKVLMHTFGAEVFASPSEQTEAGRRILASDPDCRGSLGLAISEAVEDAAGRADTNYALGSVLNHVCLHQTVIGLEAREALESIDEYPDIVIACCGGGSNFAGLSFPFVGDKLKKKLKTRIIGVEPATCPTLTQGEYAYDYSDVACTAPIAKMYTLGHGFMPSPIYAGGLRYHGMSPIVSRLFHEGVIEARAAGQREVFDAALLFARAEGIVPAPESSHAIRAAVDEALACKESGEKKTILFGLSGNGYFDMSAYESYLNGAMTDVSYSPDEAKESLSALPQIG